MKIYRDFSGIDKNKNAVITIGTFDGVHLGHAEIFTNLIEVAKKKQSESFVITFEPHPRSVVSKDFSMKFLTSLDEKLRAMEKIGIENVLIIGFNQEIAGLTALEFIEKLIKNNINIKGIILGHDHKFGKNRSGDENEVKRIGGIYNFDVNVIPQVNSSDFEISSTRIRHLLNDKGDVELVKQLLGRNYSLSGKVIEGVKRGRALGFPTANIQPDDEKKLIPRIGVYLVSSVLNDQVYYGVMNIGYRPTFQDVEHPVIEIHFIDFNSNLYNEGIKIEFISRLRDEMTFSGKQELIACIKNDIENAKKIINK